jgi:hypothetical protein
MFICLLQRENDESELSTPKAHQIVVRLIEKEKKSYSPTDPMPPGVTVTAELEQYF